MRELDVKDHQNSSLAWLMPWGKTDRNGLSRARNGPPWNPLFAHMLDVGACVAELWDRYLSVSVRARLTEAFGAGDEALARRVTMFLAALHDLGKASSCHLRLFGSRARKGGDLRRARAVWERQARAAGLPLAPVLDAAPYARHEHITAAHLPRLLGCDCHECLGDGPRHDGLHAVAALLGGHHGHIPNADSIGRALKAARPATWEPVHRNLVDNLARLMSVETQRLSDVIRPERPSALPIFAGLVVLADWIASDEEHFTYRDLAQPVEQWWYHSQRQAAEALTALRLETWRPAPTDWPTMFPETPEPRPFQEAAMAIMPDDGPALVIVETDTGSGKTRLALWCAHHLARTCGYHGFYMAMPTRAAVNQTAAEIAAFLGTSLGSSRTANLAVVHQYAEATDTVHELVDRALRSRPHTDGLDRLGDLDTVIGLTQDTENPSQDQRAVLDPWYLRRCLGLVSPFGIGTVDQAALASQPSRHWFLRLFGLANKTVIIDEAHAYELFQQRLLNATVSWLADAGASVVVLSATLPSGVRDSLITAWCGGHRVARTTEDGTGPVTIVDRHGTVRHTGPRHPSTPLTAAIDLLPDPGHDELARRLLTEGAPGGITVVIRNRPETAHRLHTALLAQAAEHGWQSDEFLLIHGRLLPRDRAPIEDTIADLLGLGSDRRRRNPNRPGRLMVVGTQILEQSLDIDCDRLYSDLAPIDLLIQRKGRLHRHSVNDPERPRHFRRARMTILWRRHPDGLPDVEPPDPRLGTAGNPDGAVYAPYTLAATWRLLRDRTDPNGEIRISTPHDSRDLIEAVYTATPDLADSLIARTWETWQAELTDQSSNANARAFRPFDEESGTPTEVEQLASGEAHGDADGHRKGSTGIAALSRFGEPATDVVVLYRQHDDTYTYDAAGHHPADLRNHRTQQTDEARDAHRAQQRDLLLNTIGIPDRWFHGENPLRPVEAWQPLPHEAVCKRIVLVLDPTGTCIRGPIGQLAYNQHTGLVRTTASAPDTATRPGILPANVGEHR